jgi:hypothetical protein
MSPVEWTRKRNIAKTHVDNDDDVTFAVRDGRALSQQSGPV